MKQEREKEVDMVNHPNHYNMHPTGIECNTIIEWFAANIATAMGYMWRAPHKGTQIQDLKKARWHLNREIERLETLQEQEEESERELQLQQADAHAHTDSSGAVEMHTLHAEVLD